MAKFVGRERELAKLNALLGKKIPQLIVIKGRRRIGKSRLLLEFGKTFQHTYRITGLAPEKGVTAQMQKAEFTRQLKIQLHTTPPDTTDWGDLFWHLAQQTQHGRVLIILDEVSWMAMNDPTFLPKLQVAWESYFKQNSELILALCSSISMWIDENILSSTGFMGRLSFTMTLHELSLTACKEFWADVGGQVSTQEKLLTLAVTGGIPRYLEEINPNLSVEHNIKNMCFTPEGILFREFDQIFSDLFGNKQTIYRDICTVLAEGATDAPTLYERVGLTGGGDDYKRLEHLILSGFISKDYRWHLQSGRITKMAYYRLSDNYCRFYLKYIFPNREKIMNNEYHDIPLTALPNWSSIMGLQVENLVLNNRHLIKQTLGLTQQEIICDNPFLQKATKTKKGCQIDYLIQTRFNTLYICEIKYSRDLISKSVIDEIQQKIEALGVKRNFSIRPVLIHCHQVSELIEESGFFSHIIDFSEFLA